MSTPTSLDELAVLRAMHIIGPPATVAGLVMNTTGLDEARVGDALEALRRGGIVVPDRAGTWWGFTKHGQGVAASLADRPRPPAFHVVLNAAAMHADELRTAGKNDEADQITDAIARMRALRDAAEATVGEIA